MGLRNGELGYPRGPYNDRSKDWLGVVRLSKCMLCHVFLAPCKPVQYSVTDICNFLYARPSMQISKDQINILIITAKRIHST